jgi:hypothetical protein
LGGAGFGDEDFGEEREAGLEAVPDPDGDMLAGGVFEAGNFIEVAVIELFPERAEGGGDLGVIDQPAEFGIAGAADDEVDFEAMAVETAAFVRGRQFGEEMGGFELEGFA